MQYLPPTPPPSLPATERAIEEARQAFSAGHRVPLVGKGRVACPARRRPALLAARTAHQLPPRG